jgi:thiosulfate dehydrogenase (quinone) large subunit
MVDIAPNRQTAVTEASPPRMTGIDHHPVTPPPTVKRRGSDTAVRYLLAGVRVALGWIFLWAFLDKLFGLGGRCCSASLGGVGWS